MSLDITTLIRAARKAREKSVGRKSIYIMITEEGFIVRGDHGPLTAALDVPWIEINQNRDLLENAIQLVADRLRD